MPAKPRRSDDRRLQMLLQSSLVTRVDGPNGVAWFGMLETIREYARERLARSGEEQLLRRRQAEYYAVMAERANGTESSAWLERLAWEHLNLRAALDWSISQREATIAQRLAANLAGFWIHHGDLVDASS